MAATIPYFGRDECLRPTVLAHFGYTVEVCDASVEKLSDRLRQQHVDAVAVSEDGVPIGMDVVAITRAATPAPLILFQGIDRKLDPLQFDAVIAVSTPPGDWLSTIAKTIEESRSLVAHLRSLLDDSATLRRESAQARQDSEKERTRSKQQRKNMQEWLKPDSEHAS